MERSESTAYYHGTAHHFMVGDELAPQAFTLHGPSTGVHVYLTDRDTAEEYARFAVEQLRDRGHVGLLRGRVYRVEPLGEVEVDPSGMTYQDDDGRVVTADRRTCRARIVEQVWVDE
jgi:hypothetical protein